MIQYIFCQASLYFQGENIMCRIRIYFFSVCWYGLFFVESDYIFTVYAGTILETLIIFLKKSKSNRKIKVGKIRSLMAPLMLQGPR